jgi:integrase
MKVKLRKRKMKSGNTSLYLEYYRNGKQEYEYLKLYLIDGKTKENKEALDLAEKIRVKRQNEVETQTFGFVKDLKGSDFLEYFRLLLDRRKGSNKDNWHSAYNYLKDFSGGKIMFSSINEKWLNDFKNYLDNVKVLKRTGKLSQNSKFSYFNKVKAALQQAWEEKIISENPAKRIKSFKVAETSREYLTLEELRKLFNTDCDIEILKTAFIFSALTGIRWIDINLMKWENLVDTPTGHVYRFRQKKTGGVESLPISHQAFNLLPERKGAKERVFEGLKYSAWHNIKLIKWCVTAGITRHITFHSARHTFATLQLSNGTDIYTVSKLLGHRELKTTQVYAKVIDQKKIDAVNNIPDL